MDLHEKKQNVHSSFSNKNSPTNWSDLKEPQVLWYNMQKYTHASQHLTLNSPLPWLCLPENTGNNLDLLKNPRKNKLNNPKRFRKAQGLKNHQKSIDNPLKTLEKTS